MRQLDLTVFEPGDTVGTLSQDGRVSLWTVSPEGGLTRAVHDGAIGDDEIVHRPPLSVVAYKRTQPVPWLPCPGRLHPVEVVDALATSEAVRHGPADPVAVWRYESSRAVLRFLERMLDERPDAG